MIIFGNAGYTSIYQLCNKDKSGFDHKEISVNDLVILVDENVPRGHWLLGRVTKVFPGRDGLVRVAEVKTKTNIFKRPISKLCFLEAAE